MKITQVEKLTNERWVNLFAANYEHQGHTGRWVFASRREKPYSGPGGDAVLIVPILRHPPAAPRLVLIREYRVPVGDYVIGLPAGLIEKDESIEESIRREMREETGFEVAVIKHITQPLYSSSGLTDEASALAFIDVQEDARAQQTLEASEEIEVLLLDYQQVCQLCQAPEVRIDARAWMILHSYQMQGKLE